jgi:hypothetical protein
MYRFNGLAVVAFCLTTLVSGQLVARDDGRFADSPLKPWFDRLASGRGLCCSFADMSTGTRWMGTIVYEYMGNGSSCLMPRL